MKKSIIKAKRKAISTVTLATCILNMYFVSPYLREEAFYLNTNVNTVEENKKLRKKYLLQKKRLLGYQNQAIMNTKAKNNPSNVKYKLKIGK